MINILHVYLYTSYCLIILFLSLQYFDSFDFLIFPYQQYFQNIRVNTQVIVNISIILQANYRRGSAYKSVSRAESPSKNYIQVTVRNNRKAKVCISIRITRQKVPLKQQLKTTKQQIYIAVGKPHKINNYIKITIKHNKKLNLFSCDRIAN